MDKSLILNKIKSHLGFQKDSQLATFLGIKHNTLSTWRSRNSIDYDLIISKCDEIDANWLITGKGEMLKKNDVGENVGENVGVSPKSSEKNGNLNGNLNTKSDENTPPKDAQVYAQVSEKNEPITPAFQPPAVVVVDSTNEPNIIMVDTKAAAGMAVGYADPTYYQDKPAFSLPELSKEQHVCVQIAGDSMHPTVKDSEYVIAKQLFNINDIVGGKVYLLLTADGVVCKRLYHEPNKDYIRVVSDNDIYAPYKEPLQGVIAIYEAVKKLSDDFRNWSTDVRKDIYSLKSDIQDLKELKIRMVDLESAIKKAGLL